MKVGRLLRLANNIIEYEVFSEVLPVERETFDNLLSALRDRALFERLSDCGMVDKTSTSEYIMDLDFEISEYYYELCLVRPDEIVVKYFEELYAHIEAVRDEKWKSVC